MIARCERELPEFLGRPVREGIALQVAPERLDRVQFGSVGREEVGVDLGMLAEPALDRLASVSEKAIPEDQHRPLDLETQRLEEAEEERSRDVRVRVERKVKSYPLIAWRQSERRDGRHFPMTAGLLIEQRGLAAWRPSPPNERRHHEAGLVDKDQVSVQIAGFFLSRGQSTLTQRRIASSSRSRAMRSGFWGLHPIERSNRGT